MYNMPQTLPELYQHAKRQVYQEIEQKPKVIKMTESDRAAISKTLPPCISYIISENPAKSDKVNFNKLIMLIVSYFQEVELAQDDAYAKAKPFILNYPHSETYDTQEKRFDHWEYQWDYLKKNPDYNFNCSYVKGLSLPGTAFDCSKCIGKKTEKHITPSSFTSDEVVGALHQNEDGDANLFIELHRGVRCFDHTEGRWYRCQRNGHWEEDMVDQATKDLNKVIKTYGFEIKRQSNRRINAETKDKSDEAKKASDTTKKLYQRIRALQSKQRKANVLYLAAAGDNTLGITGLEWDNNPRLLGCTNGIIDLYTGKIKPIDPNAYIKTVAPTEWQGPDAPCHAWENFLSDIFNKDPDLINFIQRLFGYSLIGEVLENIFPIFWGEDGRNGKDTLFETLRHVLGDYASPIESELLLAQRFNKRAGTASPEIVALKGKRILWASETEEGRKFDVAKIKFYTGSGSIVARGLYARRLITFPPSFTIFLITNPKPKAKGDDPAFWERVFLIPLTQRFVTNPAAPNEHKADINMPKKLQTEAPGILAWLVKGCLEWQQQGLNPPDTVLQATQEYKLEEDDLTRFLNERCVWQENTEIRAGELFSAYEEWAKENLDEILKKQTFFKKMKKKVDSYRNMRATCYVGFKLKDT